MSDYILDKWVSQSNWKENIAAAIATFCKLHDLEISSKTIFENYIGGENMANFSEIERFCREWSIDNITLKFVKEHLANEFLPAFVLMNGYRTVLVVEVKDNVVHFYDGLAGYVQEDVESFYNRSMGHITLVDVNNYKKEAYYEKHEKETLEEINKIREEYQLKIIDNFLSEEECEKLMEKGEGLYTRSMVSAKEKGADSSVSEARTSSSAFLTFKDEFLDKIRERGAKLLGIPKEHFESVQLTSYTKGQQYEVHSDAFKGYNKDELIEGQRTNTILVYLNEDFEGGGTLFPELKQIVQAKTGRAVTWTSLLDDGETIDPRGYHGGLPVLYGRKTVCNLWVRDSPQKNWSN